MKSTALIRLTEGKQSWHVTYLGVDLSLPDFAPTLEVAYFFAGQVSQRESENNARRMINAFASEERKIMCPEGRVELPADAWCCKITKNMCRLQAAIDTGDKRAFLQGCDVDDGKKEKIFTTVLEKKYDGFHHVPGRYLCPYCSRNKGNNKPFSYFYKWETAILDVALNMNYDDVAVLVRRSKRSRSILNSRLCARCCFELAKEIHPENADGLHLLNFEIYPRDRRKKGGQPDAGLNEMG